MRATRNVEGVALSAFGYQGQKCSALSRLIVLDENYDRVIKRLVEAAASLGLLRGHTMRLVILPQAFRNMIPLLLTQTIILFQDISLVYAIGATDFFGAADKITQRDLRTKSREIMDAVEAASTRRRSRPCVPARLTSSRAST